MSKFTFVFACFLLVVGIYNACWKEYDIGLWIILCSVGTFREWQLEKGVELYLKLYIKAAADLEVERMKAWDRR